MFAMTDWPDSVPVPEGATVRELWRGIAPDCGPVALLAASGGGEFLCLGCGANALTDGYLDTDDGAADWHDTL